MSNLTYPLSPEQVGEDKLALSPEFRKQVGLTLFSIILFFVVYLLLVLASITLAIGCFYVGVWIIMAFPRFITVMLGLGAMCLGVSVIFFLIKFIFAVTKDVNPARVQIMEADQPKLFAFIRKLTDETNTPFPKKIFVSPDVNACVFYNSSFWSMFLPVRKNLEIGLGLVNSVNLSEFKAVMAHEFGHFSQRSMKLGSFTYNVNRIIYNMLYENNSYTKFLSAWGSVSGYLAFFASVTVKIAEGIQAILKGMYKVINKSYFGLSRQMEFHADAIAASVSGGNNLVSALSKLDLAQSCYETAVNNANDWLKQKKVSRNIFNNQLSIFQSVAKEFKLPLKEGLPEVTFEFIQSFSKSRVNYKNQWASHPSLEERKLHLEQLDITLKPNETAAWEVFEHPAQLQEILTANLYQSVKLETDHEVCENNQFEEFHQKQKEAYSLPLAYKGFYDKRILNTKNWEFEKLNQSSQKTFDEIFNEANVQLYSKMKSNESDMETIKAIKSKQIDVKSFDFDGIKYSVQDCDLIIEQLQSEISSQQSSLEGLDKEAFIYFRNKAGNDFTKIVNGYKEYNELNSLTEQYIETTNSIMSILGPFYRGGIAIEQVYGDVSTLRNNYEPELKNALRRILALRLISDETNADLFKAIQHFLHHEYVYFSNDQFINEELEQLVQACIKVSEELVEIRFRKYKQLLEAQLSYS